MSPPKEKVGPPPVNEFDLIDQLLLAIGSNGNSARTSLRETRERFIGLVPDGVMETWVNENFHGRERRFFTALGRYWEKELS